MQTLLKEAVSVVYLGEAFKVEMKTTTHWIDSTDRVVSRVKGSFVAFSDQVISGSYLACLELV